MRILISVLVILLSASPLLAAPTLESALAERKQDTRLADTLTGCLIHLADTQIRNRDGRRSSFWDASDVGDGCRGRVILQIPFARQVMLPALPPIHVRNVAGEWASEVHFLPHRFGARGKAPVAVPDSNLFVPAFVSWPLHYLRESTELPAANRPVAEMLKAAWHLDARYRRGDAYNFWLPLPDRPECSGPYNMPVEKTVLPLAKAYLNPRLAWFWRKFAAGMNVPGPEWIHRCLDPQDNTSGAYALFNIPNDADDTGTAIALQAVRSTLKNVFPDDPFFADPANFGIDQSPLELILRYRDVNRDPDLEDGRDAWKGKNSGAFLTWLRDERLPTFGEPAAGVIPLGKNNVDAVVNCNVLLALGLTGRTDAPGCEEAVRLVNRCCRERTWPAAGLYYPQYMIFPYTASRAFRDGKLSGLKSGMRALLRDLLRLQAERAAAYPKRQGSFPGGEDRTDFVSTALAVTSLLNIGRELAVEEGLAERYDQAVRSGVEYLLATRRVWKAKNAETAAEFGINGKIAGCHWDSGLFFAASFWDLAHWRSDAFTTAMALEALAKYRMGWEFGKADIMTGRRLVMKSWPVGWTVE